MALLYAVLNKGAVFPLPGSPSQSKPDGFASSPKVGAFSRRQTFRYIQNLSLWERWHREAMTERARPAEAAQGLGLDRASDRAALPQGSAKPSAQLLASVLALSGASRQLSSLCRICDISLRPEGVFPKGGALGKGGKSTRSA